MRLCYAGGPWTNAKRCNIVYLYLENKNRVRNENQDQRVSPLACRRRGVLDGAGIGTAEGAVFSSFRGDPNIDCRDDRLAVVRGSLLLAATLNPLPNPNDPFEPPPSRLVGRNGMEPLMPFRCRLSLPSKYPFDWADRLLVGVGGIE